MKRKNLWRLLIALGLMIVVSAVLAFCKMPERTPISASVPAQNIDPADAALYLEPIADEAVPLAAPQTVFASERVGAPVVPESAAMDTPKPTKNPATTPAPTDAPAAPSSTPTDPTPTPAIPTPTPTQEPTPFPTAEPVAAAPKQDPTPTPIEPTPTSSEPTPTPVVTSTAAIRLLERANTLLSQFNACKTSDEKRALLGITNSNFSNDSFRKKLLTDMGGTWEKLEEEVVDATEYQQDKTLYVQVFIAGKPAGYETVIYSTQNAALSGNQWSTNLVYNDESATWMEYTQKHAYNDSRVGYNINGLYNSTGGWDALKETMDESDVWQPVEVHAEEEIPSPEAPDTGAEG